MAHLDQFDILKDYQQGFCKGRSCETQLIITIEELAVKSLDNRSQLDRLILDLSIKAFYKVPRASLLKKVEHYVISGSIHAGSDLDSQIYLRG